MSAQAPAVSGKARFVGNDRVLFGIIFGVLAFWLFAQTTLNIAPVMAEDLGIETSVMNIAVSITALFSGIFIVVENQFSQGDLVRIAGVEGVVDDFSLRRTKLREPDGTVHNVPNGQIVVATNLTRADADAAEPAPAAEDEDSAPGDEAAVI